AVADREQHRVVLGPVHLGQVDQLGEAEVGPVANGGAGRALREGPFLLPGDALVTQLAVRQAVSLALEDDEVGLLGGVVAWPGGSASHDAPAQADRKIPIPL